MSTITLKCYNNITMTLLEKAVAKVSALPIELQDDLASLLLQCAGEEQPVFQLTVDEEASLAESCAQEARGEFASDDHIRAIWAKHGL